MQNEFKNIFSPLQIGSVTVPNRIFMSAGDSKYYFGSSVPSERAINFWEARAAGGTGLIVTGQHHPFPTTTSSPPTAYQSDDVIPILRHVADTIHKHGARCFGQLSHPGPLASGRNVGGGAAWGAKPPAHMKSPIAPRMQEAGHEMSVEDIQRAVKEYAAVALRFKEAGYDGVEIRAVWGMFQAQFLSTAMNLRTDEYGGTLENRLRFFSETIGAVRGAVGKDFVVGTRFTGDEFIDWTWWSKKSGFTADEAKEIAKRLEADGNLDYLFGCAGTIYPPHVPPMYYPLGAFLYLAAEIKKVVTLPVFTIGRINDPVLAEEILANHQADMVGMYRGLIADPEWVNKARDGKAEDIRRCIACCEGCGIHYGSNLFTPISCTVNVEVGREKEFVIEEAEHKKRVLIVGGGGAGLEAARVAALRGHRVSLYEKEGTLARDLTIAAKAPGRDSWEDVRRYYLRQMDLLDIELHMDVSVTARLIEEMVEKDGYDAVIIATGATPFIPEVSGIESTELIVAEAPRVLEGKQSTGDHFLMVAYEDHSIALTVADFLADQGKTGCVITESLYAGALLDMSTLETIYARLLSKGVTITPLTGLKGVRGETAVLRNTLTGVETEMDGMDTIVFAVDGLPNDGLYRALKGKIKELHMIGQCVSPRRLLDSIFDGARVGNTI